MVHQRLTSVSPDKDPRPFQIHNLRFILMITIGDYAHLNPTIVGADQGIPDAP